ncbi:hypothetical protein OF83DRAFT_1175013 [Amylostereum chailletii]|nr:hypothetical protein OF83DRAFT_1175013 [Amylostereum chailletii]
MAEPTSLETTWMSAACALLPAHSLVTRDVKVAQGARNLMEKHIEAIEKVLLHAKHRRNALSSISVLPPEILLEIFRQLKAVWHPIYLRNNLRHTTGVLLALGWIYVTHVCHEWREIAIYESTLWSTVNCGEVSSTWALDMLHRSGSASLRFSMDLRIQLLHLTSYRADDLIPLLKVPMSGLEELTLYGFYDRPLPLLPADILTFVAPALRSLTLIQCTVTWNRADHPILPNLNRLSIWFHQYGLDSVPGLSGFTRQHHDMVHFLESMPKLQTLSLNSAPPFMSVDPSPTATQWDQAIMLPPQLKEVTLSGVWLYALRCARFASCLVLSPATRVKIHLDFSSEPLPLAELLRRYNGPSRAPRALMVSLAIETKDHTFDIMGWTEYALPNALMHGFRDPEPSRSAFNLTLSMNVNESEEIKDPCDGIYLDKTVFMSIKGYRSSALQWRPLFRRATKVHHIKIIDYLEGLDFIEHLTESDLQSSSEQTPDDRRRCHLPVLCTLDITDDSECHFEQKNRSPQPTREDIELIISGPTQETGLKKFDVSFHT